MVKKISLILIGLAIALSLAACGSKTDNQTPTPSPGAATGADAEAEALYKQSCIACHGNNLEGKMGPNSNLQKVGGKLSKEQIVTKINNGGNGMTAFKGKLTDAEIDILADWLAAKK